MAGVDSQQLILQLQRIEQRCQKYAAGLPQKEEATQFWEGMLFEVAGVHLVTALGEVKEILNYPPVVTPVPGTRNWMMGVANIRGNLMPIVDLQVFLGGKPISVHSRTRVLVIDQQGIFAGLMVEEVLGIRYFPEELRAKSGSMAGRMGKFIGGAFVQEGKSWPVFSMRQLADDEGFQTAAA
jgi:twitching motility protein PilI